MQLFLKVWPLMLDSQFKLERDLARSEAIHIRRRTVLLSCRVFSSTIGAMHI